ncbi:zinc finger and BTB domain-containing protein 6-like [Odontesthes bonariensis]|uniref:zinc finger and BTB domain-containing protein 6-like n=1 Tax=Odontesthes bonariensis TaxID=219752 RepID=UPI003F58A928
MSSSSDTLQFSLPTHGDSILCKMNVLREENHFCDITLIIGSPNVSAAQSVRFHGHKVVLAASSDFLRDQFLLHEGQAELSVGVVSSTRVAKTLLLSCYTGLLEVPLRELVSYLVAASALRMSQVVEKCTQAFSQYLSSIPTCLKLEELSKEKGNQQLHSSGPSSSSNLKEKDAAQPSTSIQGANSKERGAVVNQSKLRVSQETEVDGQVMREIIEHVVKTKLELSEDRTLSPATLESEKNGDVESFQMNEPLFHVHNTAACLKCEIPPPAVFQDPNTSPASDIRSSAVFKELVDSFQKQNRQIEEPSAEGNMYALAAQLQQDREQIQPKRFGLSEAHLLKSQLTPEDSDSMLVQRPYLCRRCDRIFQHLENYIGHLKEHRQYLCLVCGEGFSQKSKLTRHIHIHTGTKLFRCPLCHKKFTQRTLLQEHLHLHTGDGLYTCALHLAHKPGFRHQLSEGKPGLQEELEGGGDTGLA